jgi:hypothetical protein
MWLLDIGELKTVEHSTVRIEFQSTFSTLVDIVEFNVFRAVAIVGAAVKLERFPPNCLIESLCLFSATRSAQGGRLAMELLFKNLHRTIAYGTGRRALLVLSLSSG